MTDRDLRKLSREDLLKLMLAQSKEVTRQKAVITELEKTDAQNQESLERLKEKLNEKDASIEHLKERLNEKDAQLDKLKGRLDEKDILLQKQQEELEGKNSSAPHID